MQRLVDDTDTGGGGGGGGGESARGSMPSAQTAINVIGGGMRLAEIALPMASGAAAPSSGAASAPLANMTPEQLRAQAEALARREAELAAKEAVVNDKAEKLAPPKPNWPVWCPIIVHDIQKWVPTDRKKNILKWAYINWVVTFFVLWIDVLIILIGWLATDTEGGAERFGLSFAYAVFDPMAVWFVCYYQLYKTAVRKKRSWKYGYFGISFGIQLGFMVFICIGVAQSGSAGIVGAIQFFIWGYPFMGVLYLLNFAKNVSLLIHGIVVWIKVRKHHKLTQLENPNAPDDNPIEKAKKLAQIAELAGQLSGRI